MTQERSPKPNDVRDTRVPDAVDPLLRALEEPAPARSGPSLATRIVIALVVLGALAIPIHKQTY